MWWERNREYVVKMRSLLRRSTAVTGNRAAGPRDPMKGKRDAILKTLRRLAREAKDRSLRAAAVMALGRMGGDEDAFLFLRLLRENKEGAVVVEAAAVALGILPPLEGPAREQTRAFLRETIRAPQRLPTRARGLLLLAAGLRARRDADTVLALQARGSGRKLKSDETANLIYALGLSGHPLVVPEVILAAREGTFARRGLVDLNRAHAVQALAFVEAPHRVGLLTTVLRSRRARLQTKRSAAMVLARLLREADPPPGEREAARRALLRTLRDGQDITLRGFAALAMGGARPPCGIANLKATAQSDPEVRLRPYALLALGLAARDEDDASIRKFLVKKLRDAGESEQVASTAIALGLARAHEATGLLLKRLGRNSAVPVRGAAAQGLGLMESRSAHVMQTLLTLAGEKSAPARLLEDVALALGFSGRRDVALKLVDLLRQSSSSLVQARIILALGHLDHGGTIEPLHEILKDERERTIVREFASVALAFMGDRRDEDVLFDLDAYFNLYATTSATHELMRLY
jgi:HEAT repeat protein